MGSLERMHVPAVALAPSQVGNRSWPAPSLRDPHNATYPFVTAIVKGESATAATPLGHWAIKGGDATASSGLKTMFDGPRPCAGKPPACLNKGNLSWSPMRKYGGIILGVGGDVSLLCMRGRCCRRRRFLSRRA